jgi:hypothetical protein
MFGHDTWFLNGYMFAGCNTDGVFVHLDEESVAAAVVEHDDAIPFSPGRGMTMKGYLQINDPSAQKVEIIDSWLASSADYLQALPAKVKKPRKRTQRR